MCTRSCYERARESPPTAARIPVERAAGPVLLVSAKADGMWPADEAARSLMERLDACGFSHAHAHLSYEAASHYLLPYLPALDSARIFAVERRDPAGCRASRADALERTLAFLRR